MISHAVKNLPPAVVGQPDHNYGAADVGKGLVLADQRFSDFELTDDLLGHVAGSLHRGALGPV